MSLIFLSKHHSARASKIAKCCKISEKLNDPLLFLVSSNRFGYFLPLYFWSWSNFCAFTRLAHFSLAKGKSDIYLTIWHDFCDIQATSTDFCIPSPFISSFISSFWKTLGRRISGRNRKSTSSSRLPSWWYISCCITNLVVLSLCESSPRLRIILVVVSLFVQGCCSDVLYILHNQVREKLHFNWANFLYNLCVLKISKCRQY